MEGGLQRSRASLAHREEAIGSRVRLWRRKSPGKKEEAPEIARRLLLDSAIPFLILKIWEETI
jgi:hypothetical protein